MKVSDLIRLKKTSGEIGLEIEAEGRNLLYEGSFTKWWRMEADGSLRGPETVEYVLKKPLSLVDLTEALNVWRHEQEEIGTKFFKNSKTAGIHVHINFQEEEMVHVYNFICLYYILEEFILSYCEDHRIGNHFCLSGSDADYVTDMLINFAKSGDTDHLSDEIRYASMNILALKTYGSIEFRALESTNDVDKIINWVKILLTLKEKAKGYNSPTDIIQDMSIEGDGFTSKILGDYTQLLNIENNHKKLYNGVRIAQDIAFCTEWDWYFGEIKNNNPFDPKPVLRERVDENEVRGHGEQMAGLIPPRFVGEEFNFDEDEDNDDDIPV